MRSTFNCFRARPASSLQSEYELFLLVMVDLKALLRLHATLYRKAFFLFCSIIKFHSPKTSVSSVSA